MLGADVRRVVVVQRPATTLADAHDSEPASRSTAATAPDSRRSRTRRRTRAGADIDDRWCDAVGQEERSVVCADGRRRRSGRECGRARVPSGSRKCVVRVGVPRRREGQQLRWQRGPRLAVDGGPRRRRGAVVVGVRAVTGAPPVRMDGVRIVAGLAERRPPRRDRRCGGRDGGRGATRVTALAPLGYYIRTTSEGGACTSLRPSPTRGFGSRRSTARRSGPTSTRRYTRSARTRTSHRSQPERATPGERGRHGPSLANVPDGAPSAPTDQR
jgi:hypothetical protein